MELNKSFQERCITLIETARPLLENDLGWGDYLTNLLRSIANVLLKAITFGQTSKFFTPAKSKSLLAVEKAQSELEDIKLNEEDKVQSKLD